MKFELFVATRYLRAKRRQAVIGVITGISIAGVAAGVASLIVALAINNGFRQDLQRRLLGSTSHVNLLRIESDGIKNWRALMDQLSKQAHVIAAAPDIYEQVMISRGPRARGAVLKGIILAYEEKVSDLLETVKMGSADALEEPGSRRLSESTHGNASNAKAEQGTVKWFNDVKDYGFISRQTGEDIFVHSSALQRNGVRSLKEGEQVEFNVVKGARGLQAENVRRLDDEASQAAEDHSPSDLTAVENRVAAMPPVILGKSMADELGATVGSVVQVTSPQGELTPFGMVPKYTRFRVAGIFDSGFFDYDNSWGFIRLSDAQRLFGLGDQVSVIEFKVDEIYKAAGIAQQIEHAAGPGFMTTNWMEQNKPLFRALRLERLVTFITIGLIVFVAALNILISLTMMVMEKTRDIAVLMSMGTRKAQVRRIFVTQGVLIGVVGTAIGLVLGYILSWLGGHYHVLSLAPEVYSIDYVPFAPRAIDGCLVALVAVVISLVATVYPSWSAARILPAEALRYE
jgi:lipoprotein releasing system LolC/E family transmembrane protein